MEKTHLKGHIDVCKQEEWSSGALHLLLNLKKKKTNARKLRFDEKQIRKSFFRYSFHKFLVTFQ